MPGVLRYRYLFEQMVRRELRQKYKGSALGVLWYLVNPLVLMGAYYLMFGLLIPQVKVPDYPIFLIVGLIVWIFFSQSLLSAAPSLINQSALVRKVRFPRETIPASTVTTQLFTFVVLLVLVAPVAVAIRGSLDPALLLLPLLVACLFGFVLGLALCVAILHAYFRDVEPILAAALLPWFFLSPIFFEVDTLPGVGDHEWARTVLEWVNPVAPFIDAVRSVLYSGAGPGWGRMVYVVAAAAVALVAGRALFRRMEAELAVVL
jgi:ABC-type polysaccharide/polyol phosphate export permease